MKTGTSGVVRTDVALSTGRHRVLSANTAALTPFPFRKSLWIMRSDDDNIEAVIAWTHGQWELRLLSRGALITWRRFAKRPVAVAYADLFQQDLERAGWK